MTPPSGADPDAPRGLRASLATPDGKRRYVRRLFSTIADRYDLITGLLSYGQDRRWKRRLTALAAVRPGMRALDLACGTGDIAYALQARRCAHHRRSTSRRACWSLPRPSSAAARGRGWVAGDMMALPFPAAHFDVVTTGYGIRNVPVIRRARSTRFTACSSPAACSCRSISIAPPTRVVRAVYLTYLTVVGSSLGFVLHGDPDTYRYIPESIKRYPGRRRGLRPAAGARVLAAATTCRSSAG